MVKSEKKTQKIQVKKVAIKDVIPERKSERIKRIIPVSEPRKDEKKEVAKPVANRMVPDITKKLDIRRRIANRAEFEQIDMKVYKYKNVNRSIKDVEKFINDYAKKLTDKGLRVQIQSTIDVDGIGPRSGILADGGLYHRVWNPSDYEYGDNVESNLERWYNNGNGIIKNFEMFVTAVEDEGGYDDIYNDCLYDCLYHFLREKLTDRFPKAWNLKKSLLLTRDALINAYDHMDKIEKWLDIGIFIEGDINRIPNHESKNNIHLILTNKHYTIKKQQPKLISVINSERSPVFYHFDNKTNKHHYYDGTKIKIESSQVRESKKIYLKCADPTKLKEMYDEFVYNADKLKSITKGRINMYKTGNIKQTSLTLFQSLIQDIDNADNIDDNEAVFIKNCYRGNLLYSNPYKGFATKGDVCSMYPHLMTSNIMFPYKKGEYKTITQKDIDEWIDKKTNQQYFKCGIYRCIISGDNKNKKLFRFNDNNYYTHVELKIAHKLNFSIKLLDIKNNFLYYPNSSMISAKKLFKPFVDLLFSIKKDHPNVPYAKKIMNILWGALAEKKISNTYTMKNLDDQITLDYNERQRQIKRYSDESGDTYKIECSNIGDQFVSGFARISPFLTAHGRAMIAELALKHVKDIDTIHRIYCDSFITSEKMELKDKEDCDIGDYGLEYEGELEVINLRQPIYLNKKNTV